MKRFVNGGYKAVLGIEVNAYEYLTASILFVLVTEAINLSNIYLVEAAIEFMTSYFSLHAWPHPSLAGGHVLSVGLP